MAIDKKYLSNYEKYDNFEDFLEMEIYNIMKISGMFDEEYYSESCRDVKKYGLNPYDHYVHVGIHENLNPNENFDSKWYLNQYPDVKQSNINPFLHYILWGKQEGRFINFQDYYNSKHPPALSNKQVTNVLNSSKKKVSIIVPIFNAFNDTANCIKSILEKTSKPYELILINDKSTDERINELLRIVKDYDNITVINNEENKGFVKNVNIGILQSKNDVILLNSDTIVTDRWIEKLKAVAYKNESIGTVTPVSNNAGAFSVPEFAVENEIPHFLTLNEMANIVEKSSNQIYMDTPTGNGFCMYIKRDTINSIGLFDENFGRGYCEENDFCMRAKDTGWINVIDDHTYIFHNESSSFLSESNELFKENIKLLDKKHPTYIKESNEFIASNELKSIQKCVDEGLRNYKINKFHKKRILYVHHQGTGGTPETNKDLMSIVENDYDCFLLVSNGKKLILSHFINNTLEIVEEFEVKNEEWLLEKYYIEEFRDIYFNILFKYSIDLVHIRHLIYHTFDLPKVANLLNIPVELSFHDFYFVCPSYTLIDGNNKYCGGNCTNSDSTCYMPLNNITKITNIKDYIKTWHEEINSLFSYIDNFITTSEIVKQIFLNTYPSMDSNKFYVIEHGRDFKPHQKLFETPSINKPIKILFIGNINNQKGAKLIEDLYAFDKDNLLEFHFLGNTIDELKKIGIHHGAYARDNLAKKVEKIKPSFIGIFSIWSETYCHTLTEAWSLGIPVLSTKIGVLEDRMNKNQGGWFIDHNSVQNTYNKIITISKNKSEYCKVQKITEKITFKSIEQMAEDYLQIYDNSLQDKIKVNDLKEIVNFNIIKNSNEFDMDYYKKTYNISDEINPINHYLIQGVKEGYNPSNNFDTKFYFENNLDVKNSAINPFVHYLLWGKTEKRIPKLKELDEIKSEYENKKLTLFGLKDYFFLINDSNSEILQHFDLNFNCTRDSNKFTEDLIFKKNLFNNYGIDYYYFVIPDKSIVCRNLLPFKYYKINRLINRLPLDDLSIYLDETDYFEHDTHMNYRGAKKLTPKILNTIDNSFDENTFYELLYEDSNLEFVDHYHDLLFEFNFSGPESDRIRYNAFDTYQIEKPKNLIECKIPEKFEYCRSRKSHYYLNENSYSDLRALIFHDSTIESLQFYLPFYFREMFLFWDYGSLNEDVIKWFKPDLILEIRVERFLEKIGLPWWVKNQNDIFKI